MIGLIAEVHRDSGAGFAPVEAKRIGRTERFGYCDTNPPPGKVHYAVVFVSDPAETCGTCKSGAVLDYQQGERASGVSALRGGERCPLSTFVPLRSAPSRVEVEVPQALPALEAGKPEAEPGEGKVVLRWSPVGVPGVTTYDVFGRFAGQASAPVRLNGGPLLAAVFCNTQTLFRV
jgi:hypothetical protein